MKSRLFACIALAAGCLCQAGCSSVPAATITPDMAAQYEIPPADPALDHFIAWVPADQAQTASVARAMTHISLGHARSDTNRELCGSAGLRQGKVVETLGPLPAISPPAQGGKPAWYYRISQPPGQPGCGQQDSAGLYQAMQEKLPDWIRIEQATDPGERQFGLAAPAQ